MAYLEREGNSADISYPVTLRHLVKDGANLLNPENVKTIIAQQKWRDSVKMLAVYKDKPIAFIAVVQVRMKARYYRVTRLVVLPDYQGIGVGKRHLNFIAELYTSQTKIPFYLLTSNPQIIRGNMENWKIARYGHASKGNGNTRINNEIRNSLSRKRITVSMQYVPKKLH